MSQGHRHYLDHNATTPLHPAAREAMVRAFDINGNPSSIHNEGRAARSAIDEARRQVSVFVGTAADDVIFTSGGTEALNIALTPVLTRVQPCERLLMSAGEHPAVLSGHRFGPRAETIPLNPDGVIDLGALEHRVAGQPVMLALQAVNNETGVIQPVAEAAAIVRAVGGIVVCDAVQAAGKINLDIGRLGVDALAISAHKFGGPKGVGALCFAPGRPHLGRGVIRGGGQEQGLRAGTENVIGVVGMGAATGSASQRVLEEHAKQARWRDALQAQIAAAMPDAVFFGARAPRVANTLSFTAPGIDAQVLIMRLDLEGYAVSGGSACAAGRARPSHVLKAMGVPDVSALGAVRVSLGWNTSQEDVDGFAQALARAVKTMRPRVAA